MSRQAAAAARPAEARSVRRPSSRSHTPSRKRPSSSSCNEVLPDDPMEDQIDAEIVAHLFRGAAPETYRWAVAQQEALRTNEAALRREVAESRAQTRRLRAYTAVLKTDVSGYSEAETEDRRELQRRSKEFFGK